MTKKLLNIWEQSRVKVAEWLLRFHITANVLSIMGLLISFGAAVAFAYGRIVTAGFILLVAAAFDNLDGTLARLSGKVTKFGSFLDSVIDRYSDYFIFFGIAIFYTRVEHFGYFILTGIALLGSFQTSYTKARAENLIDQCNVGFMQRPERIITLIIGSLSNHLPVALWILAIFGQIASFQRIYYTWQHTYQVKQKSGS
jgi:CDP-diacylglycerol--glycerol-3-phosphate 3-phosphatidyltransferase